MNIADHIPIGRENAIHLKKLSDRIGKSDMVVKQLVRNARRSGIPIMSDKEGYWIATSEAERKEFVNRLKGQGLARLKTAQELLKKGQRL
jgi:biotin operon repressor